MPAAQVSLGRHLCSEKRIRALERFRWIVVGLAAAVSAITQYAMTGQVHVLSAPVNETWTYAPNLCPGRFFCWLGSER